MMLVLFKCILKSHVKLKLSTKQIVTTNITYNSTCSWLFLNVSSSSSLFLASFTGTSSPDDLVAIRLIIYVVYVNS